MIFREKSLTVKVKREYYNRNLHRSGINFSFRRGAFDDFERSGEEQKVRGETVDNYVIDP